MSKNRNIADLGDFDKDAVGGATPEILTGVETLAGYKRNGKDVYQKEVYCGALPNNTTKVVTTTLPSTYIVWIDFQSSFSYGENAGGNYSIPMVYLNEGSTFLIGLNATTKNSLWEISIYCNSSVASNYYQNTKIVMHYTK